MSNIHFNKSYLKIIKLLLIGGILLYCPSQNFNVLYFYITFHQLNHSESQDLTESIQVFNTYVLSFRYGCESTIETDNKLLLSKKITLSIFLVLDLVLDYT